MQDFPVRLNYEYAHRLIGKEIGAETIKNIATSLEMKIVKAVSYTHLDVYKRQE